MSNVRFVFDQMIASVTARVEGDPLLSEDIRDQMKRQIDNLKSGFSAVDRIGSESLRASMMQAIMGAMYLGVYEVAGFSMLPGLFQQFEQTRVGRLHDARRQDMAPVKPIIARHARALWERSPDLKARPAITAGRIAPTVHKEVLRLPNRPSGWPEDHDLNIDQASKVRDRIRKHLPI